MNIKEIKNWFELAVPYPTKDNQRVQFGCHLEEIVEMFETLKEINSEKPEYNGLLFCNEINTHILSDTVKNKKDFMLSVEDRKALLDSLCDQIVTSIGVAHMFGMDIVGALQEVSNSNFSKFVDGKPVFNENGKIMKGLNYFEPKLQKFIENDPTTQNSVV